MLRFSAPNYKSTRIKFNFSYALSLANQIFEFILPTKIYFEEFIGEEIELATLRKWHILG